MAKLVSTEPSPRKGWLAAAGVASLVFVIYGSLVPLRFSPMPLQSAIDQFRAIRYVDLSLASRVDWATNMLLVIPLAFAWCGVLWPRKRVWLRAASAAVVVLACGCLSVAIEFAQVFFPPRTPSINDIYAQMLGSIVGVALWCAAGPGAVRWLHSTSLMRGTAGIAQRLLAAYLIVLFGYNLLPLDLTVSPVEIYHKWGEGKVILLPFSAGHGSAAQFAYDILSDIAIWIPAAALWRWAYRTPALSAWRFTVAAAAVLEVLQLFVYSRYTDLTDVITAGAGGALGAWLTGRWAKAGGKPQAGSGRRSPPARSLPWIAATIAWLGVLAAVFWYPFDFNFNRGFVRDHLLGLTQMVPLEVYYFGTEYRAITEFLHKIGFMLPFGLLLGGLQTSLVQRMHRGLLNMLLPACIMATAIGIEAGQVFLPGKNVDLTDFLLETLGGLTGYVVYLAAHRRIASHAPGDG